MAQTAGDRIAIGTTAPSAKQPRAEVISRDKGNLTVRADKPDVLRAMIASGKLGSSVNEQPDGTFTVAQSACRIIR